MNQNCPNLESLEKQTQTPKQLMTTYRCQCSNLFYFIPFKFLSNFVTVCVCIYVAHFLFSGHFYCFIIYFITGILTFFCIQYLYLLNTLVCISRIFAVEAFGTIRNTMIVFRVVTNAATASMHGRGFNWICVYFFLSIRTNLRF